MKRLILVVVAIGIFIACNNIVNNKEDSNEKEEDLVVNEGEILLKKYCYACHHPTMETGRIAPPMQYVKEHYIKEGTTEKEFTESFISFVKHPNKQKAKMRGAIANFGLMPQQEFPEESLQKIAKYIYNHEIDGPDKLEGRKKKHDEGRDKNNIDQGQTNISKSDLGLEIAMNTKAVLGKNLMSKIQSEGTEGALEFCNINAIELTDSMAKVYKTSISRLTDKPRNPNNLASKEELSTIRLFKHRTSEGAEVEAVIKEEEDKVNFYFPITTNSMCMQCHGKAEVDIKASTLAKIKALYPEDKATGYDVNEIRGIWKVVFDK